MLLNSETHAKLLGLAPRVLFHGTRYLVPILIHDELALSADEHVVNLTLDPEEAARCAARGPRRFDDGRGAILALDWARLEAPDDFCLSEGGAPGEFGTTEPIAPLSDYLVGVFWLDSLVPGLGIQERFTPHGPLEYPAHAYRGAQDRFWALRNRMYARNVPTEAFPAVEDFGEGGIYGEVLYGPNGLPRHPADNMYSTVLPGVRLADVERRLRR